MAYTPGVRIVVDNSPVPFKHPTGGRGCYPYWSVCFLLVLLGPGDYAIHSLDQVFSAAIEPIRPRWVWEVNAVLR
jgi:hypothetical protein